MAITKGTRYQKIIGLCGEMIICNWLSRSGFEVAIIDHTGIDLIAYREDVGRLGITVKSRTRIPGKEGESVNVFEGGARRKMMAACNAFGCVPWIGVYVETENAGDIFLTSLKHYDTKYRVAGRVVDTWKMTRKHIERCCDDNAVKYVHVDFDTARWF
jgi:hypothetical protein